MTNYELIKEPALGHDYEEVLDLFEPYLVKKDAYGKITDFVPSRKVFKCNRCQNIEYVYVKAEIKPFTNMDDFVFNGYTAYITDGERYSGYTVQDLVDSFVKLKIENVYKNNYEDIDFVPPGELKIMFDSGDICLWQHPGETIIVSLYYEPDDWQYYEDCQFNIHITVPYADEP